MTRTTVLAAAAAAVLIGAGASTSAAVAPPPPVQCGDVITGVVVLTADLVCPTGPYGLKLTLGATLDLGGHRVVGGAQRPVAGDPLRTGIEIPPKGDVTIRGGTVTGWAYGVSPAQEVMPEDFERARATLDGVTLRDNSIGVASLGYIGETPELLITSSRIVGNALGLWSWSAQLITVESSRIVGNDTGAQSSAGGRGFDVVESVVAGNGTALECQDGAFSVVGSTLRDNEVAVRCDGGATVMNSVVAGNEVGLSLAFDSYIRLHQSVLRDNGTAVRMGETYGSIVGNTFVRNDVAVVGTGEWATTTIEGNEFRRNGDAILSVGVGSTLERNTAIRNERWGIHAPGAVDLGGNRAWGNGNEPQCVGVVCDGSGPVS